MRIIERSGGKDIRKITTFFIILIMVTSGMISFVPFMSQEAEALYITPGGMGPIDMEWLVANSGGAVTGFPGWYQINENLMIEIGDILMVNGDVIQMAPDVGIMALGDIDCMPGSAFIPMGGPWFGIEVMGFGLFAGTQIQGAVDGLIVNGGQAEVHFSMISECLNDGIQVNMGFIWVDSTTLITDCGNRGIYLEDPMAFSLSGNLVEDTQISDCLIGIEMASGAGGPQFGSNLIHNCQTGFIVRDTSAQIMDHTIRLNDVGVYGTGPNMMPNLMGCEIWGNTNHGVWLEDYMMGINDNHIYDNGGSGVYLSNSNAMLNNNQIYGKNATPGSYLPGQPAITITGNNLGNAPWFSMNTIVGGYGDDYDGMNPFPGGHGIFLDNFQGDSMFGPQLIIENNMLIKGGAGGMNGLDDGIAGNGGSGIFSNALTDIGDPFLDNHAIKITNNLEISGGDGGENLAMLNGYSGNGGDAIYALETNDIGTMLIQGNGLIQGGDGGLNLGTDLGMGVYGIGIGGDAVCLDTLSFGGLTECKNNPMVLGGEGGQDMTGFQVRGGAGFHFIDSMGIYLDGNSGHTQDWYFTDLDGCNGDIDIYNLSIDDSDNNTGGISKVNNTNNPGGDWRNWNFTVRDTVKPAINGTRSTNISITLTKLELKLEDGIVLDDCDDWTLGNFLVNITDGSAIKMNNTKNTFAVDSFFDVEYNITFPDAPTGILIENSSKATIKNSTVKVKNGSAVKNKKSNDSYFVDSFFDVEYEIEIPESPQPNILIQNSTNTTVKNSTIKGGKAGVLVKNVRGLILDDNEFNGSIFPEPGYLPWREGVRIEDDDVDEDRDGIPDIYSGNTFTDWNISINLSALGDCGNRRYSIFDNIIIDSSYAGVKLTLDRFDTGSALDMDLINNSIFNSEIGFDILNLEEFSWPHPDEIQIDDNLLSDCNRGLFYIVAKPGTAGRDVELDVNGNTFTGIAPPGTIYVRISGCAGIGIDSNIFENGNSGIVLENCSGFAVRGNVIENNSLGISLTNCTNATIYHNNFIDNTLQAIDDGSAVLWDNGYPSGGNYWSDYGGVDLMSGSLQDQAGSDGIGDTPYIIDGDSLDRYPYMAPLVIIEHKQDLIAGWNLISVPMRQCNQSLEEVLSSINGKWDQVYVYDATVPEPWLTASTDWPDALNTVHDLDRNRGIWVHTTEPCTYTSYGVAVVSTNIQLYAGWNLVGYPSLNAVTVAVGLAGTNWDIVEAFDPGAPYMVDQLGAGDLMEPGNGYWVHVPSDVIWTVNW